MNPLRALGLAALLLGCASTAPAPVDAGAPADVPPTDVPATDTPVTDAPIADASTDTPATDTGPTIVCGSAGGTFPTFDARCTADEDCAVGVHQTDCCGNMAALGMRRGERPAFDAAEAICRPMYPGCGCPTRGVLADDGQWSQDRGALRVRCTAGRCVTAVAAAPTCPGVTCGPGQLCARGCCGIPGCTPPPNRCVTVPDACAGRPACGCLEPGACPSGSCHSVEGDQVVCLCA